MESPFLYYLQDQYEAKHPDGVNPVQLNDVIFTLHAVFATMLVIVQCIIYDVSKLNIVSFKVSPARSFFFLVVRH